MQRQPNWKRQQKIPWKRSKARKMLVQEALEEAFGGKKASATKKPAENRPAEEKNLLKKLSKSLCYTGDINLDSLF